MSEDSISPNETLLIDKIRNLFKRKRKVKKGDLGVYEDTLSYTTIGNTARTLHYDVFIKVKAVEVYDDLVEVDVVSVTTSESNHKETCDLINTDNLRYLKPNKVKWQKIEK